MVWSKSLMSVRSVREKDCSIAKQSASRSSSVALPVGAAFLPRSGLPCNARDKNVAPTDGLRMLFCIRLRSLDPFCFRHRLRVSDRVARPRQQIRQRNLRPNLARQHPQRQIKRAGNVPKQILQKGLLLFLRKRRQTRFVGCDAWLVAAHSSATLETRPCRGKPAQLRWYVPTNSICARM